MNHVSLNLVVSNPNQSQEFILKLPKIPKAFTIGNWNKTLTFCWSSAGVNQEKNPWQVEPEQVSDYSCLSIPNSKAKKIKKGKKEEKLISFLYSDSSTESETSKWNPRKKITPWRLNELDILFSLLYQKLKMKDKKENRAMILKSRELLVFSSVSKMENETLERMLRSYIKMNGNSQFSLTNQKWKTQSKKENSHPESKWIENWKWYPKRKMTPWYLCELNNQFFTQSLK